LNAFMRWINVSTPSEVAVDFYGGVLGCDVIRAPHPATADEPTRRTARSRYSWVPLVSIGESVSSAGARLPGARSSRLIHSRTGPPVALVLNGDDDVWLLAADMPGATVVGDTRAVAGGLRVMELTPAVARLFGDVFGEHFVATVEAHETSMAARDPLVFVAAKALAPTADSSWIPVFRVVDIAAAVSEAIAHGAIVGAAPTAAQSAAPMTASLRDPFGAPFLLVHGAVTSWESLDATHHIISLTRARFDDSDSRLP
jgi:predicted enzyme related to lactoylglutathione lyase